jgi:hypothetical protein
LQLASAGTAVGTGKEGTGNNWSTSLTTTTYGTTSDTWAWSGVSSSVLNGSTFGVYFQNVDLNTNMSVDSISITVTYTGGSQSSTVQVPGAAALLLGGD